MPTAVRKHIPCPYVLCGIYVLTFANGKKYVGQAVNIADRWRTHRGAAWGKSSRRVTRKYRAWRKYGEPTLELLHLCLRSELDAAEIAAIALIGTLVPNGYNETTGGGGGNLGPEWQRLIREGRAAYVSSPEGKAALTKRALSPAFKQGGVRYRETDEFKDRQREQLAHMNSDPEIRRRQREGCKRRSADPAYRAWNLAHMARLQAERRHRAAKEQQTAAVRAGQKTLLFQHD